MIELLNIYDLHKRCGFSDKDVKRAFERGCNPSSVAEIIELLHNRELELDDLSAYKLLSIELANRKGFDSVVEAINSIDFSGEMKTLKSLIDQHKSYYEAGKNLNVNAQQLKRLIDKGALYNDKGEIFIPSKTKLKL